jgi:hypothetical protein
VKLQYASVADFTSSGAALSSNGAATGDLHCDDYSNAFGDVSGVVVNNCRKEADLKVLKVK